MTKKGADFRAEKKIPSYSHGWLRYIGSKLGYPMQMLLKMYLLIILSIDVMYLSVMAYKEFWLSILYMVLPTRKKNLDEEVSLVVGSSRGIGREIAVKQAQLGSRVVCIDIQDPEQEVTSKIIKQNGHQVYYYQCDITDRKQVEKTIETIERENGEISMLFHCCSIPTPHALLNSPPSVKATIDLSVTSYFYLLESILPRMKKYGKGHIVFLTSTAARNRFHHRHALTVSKFAVQGLYESIVDELRVAKLSSQIKTTLVHIYPIVVCESKENDIVFRVPGFFGSIRADIAAEKVLDGVRKNQSEISVPGYCLHFSRILKTLPKNIIFLLRDYLDTGIEF